MADAAKSVTVQYFYKIRWGFQDEFVELFEAQPLATVARPNGVWPPPRTSRAYTATLHGDGRQDWDLRGGHHVIGLAIDGGAHRSGHRAPPLPRRGEV